MKWRLPSLDAWKRWKTSEEKCSESLDWCIYSKNRCLEAVSSNRWVDTLHQQINQVFQILALWNTRLSERVRRRLPEKTNLTRIARASANLKRNTKILIQMISCWMHRPLMIVETITEKKRRNFNLLLSKNLFETQISDIRSQRGSA